MEVWGTFTTFPSCKPLNSGYVSANAQERSERKQEGSGDESVEGEWNVGVVGWAGKARFGLGGGGQWWWAMKWWWAHLLVLGNEVVVGITYW